MKICLKSTQKHCGYGKLSGEYRQWYRRMDTVRNRGQAAREADGWENVTGNLKETWRQLQAVVGQSALKIATSVVKRMTAAIAQLTVYARSAVSALSQFFGWDTEEVSASMATVSDGADTGTESIEETTAAAEKLKKTVAGFDQLNILSESSSKTASEETDSGGSVNAGQINTAAQKAENAFSDVFKSLKDKWGKDFDEFIGSLKGRTKALKDLAKTIGSNFSAAWEESGERIEDTELDVELIALPTIAGTNILSVGTEVQPSAVQVRGRIKEVQNGSGNS